MTREKLYYKPCSTCHNDDCVFTGSEDSHIKCEDYTSQEPILDKIRAEIENDWQLKKFPCSPFSCGLRRAIEIIDKYKAETEET